MNPFTDSTPDRVLSFQRERPHLLAVAFRILGAEADAEDAVQEAWVRYSRAAEVSQVQNLSAWLTTIVTRLCLDHLRRRRETPQAIADDFVDPNGADDDPAELAVLASELATAFTVVLEELTPPQRVALVLHDAFGMPFDELAHVLGTTSGSAKKLASRARGRVRQRAVAPTTDPEEVRQVVDAFLNAARDGDTHGLISLLDPDVIRTADPQVLPPGAAQRIHGAEAVVAETRLLQANARRARLVSINGRPGIAVFLGTDVQAALVFKLAGGRIVAYDVIADPQRLALLSIEA